MSDFTLSKIDDMVVDKVTFRWVRRNELSLLPPVVSAINGKFYQIANFANKSNEYLATIHDSFTEMINISTAFYDNISLPEISNILNIAEKFDVPANDINILKTRNINNEKYISSIKKLASMHTNILAYLHSKEVPLKTITLLTSLDEHHIEFISSYLDKKSPSVQSFKNFIEQLADFKDDITETVYNVDFKFPQHKSKEHISVDNEFEKLNKMLNGAQLTNHDFFETANISMKFDLKTYDDFKTILGKLTYIDSDVEKFFKLLKDNDIY